VPFSDPQRHLHDILEAIEKIGEFVDNMDFAAYQADEKTKAAVERKIQILTEAIIRLGDESPGAYPEIDQKGDRGMGNLLRHSYHRVDDNIVWGTVKEDLPALKDAIKAILNRLGS
jgi:uncharacterized protein with HEPN domain